MAKSYALGIYFFDQELAELIIQCHKAKVKFDDYDFYENLIAEGVHSEIAEELRIKYEFGHSLLCGIPHKNIIIKPMNE